jgi:hypothetical protein
LAIAKGVESGYVTIWLILKSLFPAKCQRLFFKPKPPLNGYPLKTYKSNTWPVSKSSETKFKIKIRHPQAPSRKAVGSGFIGFIRGGVVTARADQQDYKWPARLRNMNGTNRLRIPKKISTHRN